MLPQILSQLEILIEAHTLQLFLYMLLQKLGQLEIWIQAQIFETFLYKLIQHTYHVVRTV